ncbi:MAG: HAD-IC family P-type ATPase [Lactobacillus sp.]|uniref:HAD-IC family P-type ATPase n=1 Tax=Bombilactobacillus bombi TaxID=1303590 RepID=UPI0035EF6BB9|nr:HAD-IC family P-type ATPase [Lactobacillus sp.]
MKATDVNTGLTDLQVQEQIKYGNTNQVANHSTSVTMILSKNLFTLFNFINLILAIIIFSTGSYENLFFLGPVVANFLIGSYQEIKAKKQLDRLTFLNRQTIQVLRNGQVQKIFQDELVLHDLIIVQRGDQLPADGVIRQSAQIEVDESNITGESNSISKKPTESVLSGSLVLSGQALVELTAVGANSFANKLAHDARQQTHNISQLMDIISRIIKILTYIIIPLGLILFAVTFYKHQNLNQAILGTSASIIGMIPQGLVLLTSVALAVGAMHLTRKKVLVKSLTALEALARVDTLCLDKTGTITTGNLQLSKIIPSELDEKQILTISQQIMQATNEHNETAQAILTAQELNQDLPPIASIVAFSSARKWSAVNWSNGQHYAIGAPSFLLQDAQQIATAHSFAQQGYRVLAVIQSQQVITETISQPELLGFLLINDEVRSTATNTFEYLRQQGINIKVISGDDPATVQNIAQKVALPNSQKAIDMSTIDEHVDWQKIAAKYTIFGRTLPEQKQKLIQALQAQNHKVAMTGDGVNDVLAMRQSDCGIAIAGNSDAAENAADFVLLNKNFDSLINVLNEGRRVINNIERVAALYLIKTMYSVMLTILFIFLHTGYPFYPAQMTPINALTVGIPTFFLALRPDFSPPAGRFFRNVMQVALPAAIDITLVVTALVGYGHWQHLIFSQTSTLAVLTISLIGFAALWIIARPINRGTLLIFITLFALNLLIFTVWGKPFKILNIFQGSIWLDSLIILILFYPLYLISREIIVRYFLKNKKS